MGVFASKGRREPVVVIREGEVEEVRMVKKGRKGYGKKKKSNKHRVVVKEKEAVERELRVKHHHDTSTTSSSDRHVKEGEMIIIEDVGSQKKRRRQRASVIITSSSSSSDHSKEEEEGRDVVVIKEETHSKDCSSTSSSSLSSSSRDAVGHPVFYYRLPSPKEVTQTRVSSSSFRVPDRDRSVSRRGGVVKRNRSLVTGTQEDLKKLPNTGHIIQTSPRHKSRDAPAYHHPSQQELKKQRESTSLSSPDTHKSSHIIALGSSGIQSSASRSSTGGRFTQQSHPSSSKPVVIRRYRQPEETETQKKPMGMTRNYSVNREGPPPPRIIRLEAKIPG